MPLRPIAETVACPGDGALQTTFDFLDPFMRDFFNETCIRQPDFAWQQEAEATRHSACMVNLGTSGASSVFSACGSWPRPCDVRFRQMQTRVFQASLACNANFFERNLRNLLIPNSTKLPENYPKPQKP